eukprot:7085095-Pyramimonas_sp.AAC.1
MCIRDRANTSLPRGISSRKPHAGPWAAHWPPKDPTARNASRGSRAAEDLQRCAQQTRPPRQHDTTRHDRGTKRTTRHERHDTDERHDRDEPP